MDRSRLLFIPFGPPATLLLGDRIERLLRDSGYYEELYEAYRYQDTDLDKLGCSALSYKLAAFSLNCACAQRAVRAVIEFSGTISSAVEQALWETLRQGQQLVACTYDLVPVLRRAYQKRPKEPGLFSALDPPSGALSSEAELPSHHMAELLRICCYVRIATTRFARYQSVPLEEFLTAMSLAACKLVGIIVFVLLENTAKRANAGAS